MPRLVTLARASKLVGISRNHLQKQVRDGNLISFEGMVSLSDLSALYPDTALEDNSLLEHLEQIMNNAAIRARNPSTTLPPDVDILAKRVNILSDEIVDAKLEMSIYSIIFAKLKTKLNKLVDAHPEISDDAHRLKNWLNSELDEITSRKFDSNKIAAADTFLRLMAATVKIEPSGHEFLVDGSNSILDSALASGLAVNYGCSNGNCGKCKARVISGEVKKIHHHDYIISEQDKLKNYILTCSHTAVTDLVLEANEASNENDIPEQTITAKVRKIQFIADDMCVLTLKTPRTERLRFLAGQNVELEIEGVAKQKFPIASCPCDDMNIQFHIKKDDSDYFRKHLFHKLKNSESIIINGPNGHFVSQNMEDKKIVFIAYGLGFAPIKSLIEHTMTLDLSADIYLYWIVDKEEQLYLHNHCRSWNDAFEHFIYTPIVSQNEASPLYERIKRDIKELADTQYLICGEQSNVDEIYSELEKNHINTESIQTEIL